MNLCILAKQMYIDDVEIIETLLITLKPSLSLPSRLENKKDKCSHLVIWTSTLSIIRIQKLFVIGN
jgi:hypothetical protein